MKSSPSLLAHLLEEFFLNYLPKVRGVSPHTLQAYRDALRLFLLHVAQKRDCTLDRLGVEHLQVAYVLSFLEALERQRNNSILFRFTIIWESMIVIIREKRAEVIEIIWERVEPRAAGSRGCHQICPWQSFFLRS
jgi:site-specific recombinase XerC